MLFNSIQFMIFFPIVTVVYFCLPHRFRWIWLLLASCRFYMEYSPKYILILFFVILVDYWAGLLIEKSAGARRKQYLVLSILANVAILAVFKYYNFFIENVEALAHAIGWNYSLPLLRLVLPIGLSFHTFQSMSYTIEVYRGHQKAERHLGIYALYVLFFPQLVAGPIERPQNILHQFKQRYHFDYERVTSGLKQMLWGFFMKVVIADRLAQAVNHYYDAPGQVPGPALFFATLCFALQIYCDFAGYSNIALGCARVLGFELMTNFDRPYSARTVSEFWRRWHISLSTWFKDYVYVPLGGSRRGKTRHALNLMATFLLSGLWHGANWTFVIWGGLNGLYLVVGDRTRPWRQAWAQKLGLKESIWLRGWQKFATVMLICFAWIFFRAKDLTESLTIVKGLSRGWLEPLQNLLQGNWTAFYEVSGLAALKWDTEEWLTAGISLVVLKLVHDVQMRTNFWELLNQKATWVRWATYYAILYLILVHGKYMLQEQFIYFRF